MNENPDDWYNDLQERENNPDQNRGGGLRDSVSDHAKDYAHNKLKEAGTDAAKKLGKEGAKEGGKALGKGAVSSGTGAATGGAAAGTGAATGGAAAGTGAATGGAAAAGAGVAATTGIETAGIGVAVGALIALLGNKTFRNVTIGAVAIGILAQIAIVIMAVMMPIIIMTAVMNSVIDTIKDSIVVRGATMVAEGVTGLAGAIGDTIDSVTPWDGAVPFVTNEYDPSGTIASTDEGVVLATATTASAPQVAGAQANIADSRLSKLYSEMNSQGYFKLLYTKYGLRIKSPDGGKTYRVFYRDKLHKKYDSKAALDKAFQNDKLLRKIMTAFIQDDLKIVEYTKRVTLAEKGMSNYSTSQLFVPGGNSANDDDAVSDVRKSSLETQNSPFMSQMSEKLGCVSTDCGTWVASTINEDATTLVDSVSNKTHFLPDGTLRSKMDDRAKEETSDDSFIQWYAYVKEVAEAAKLTNEDEIANNTFIQGVVSTRKEQAARQFLHWSTIADQYKASQLTNASASALFRSFEGGSNAKSYRYLNGKTGGTAFKDSEKINDNKLNPVRAVFNSWLEEEPKEAKVVKKALDLTDGFWGTILGAIGFDDFYAKLRTNDTDEATVKVAGYKLASKIMIPVCDATTTGSNFMNCIYAGGQTIARDVGISDYGHSGKITRQEAKKRTAYVDETQALIDADRPLLARLTDINSERSFARTFLMNASIPFGTDATSGLFSYFLNIPKQTLQLALSSGDRQVLADSDEEVNINNIDRAGNTLDSLLNENLSATLDDPNGTIASCLATQENQENLCRTDETTYLALAGKFGLLPDTGTSFSFTVASYNILHSGSHPEDSIRVGGCDASPVEGDPACTKTRTNRQLQIITGQTGNPAFDLFGTQETSPAQHSLLRAGLAGYDVFPQNTGRMHNAKDGAVAIWWNTSKFSKVEQGKAAGISNTSKSITNPWVGLQTSTGQKVYAISVHYAIEDLGGSASSIEKSARLTMDWVRSKAKGDSIVIVMGDFNDTLAEKNHYCVFTEDSILQHLSDLEQGDPANAGCSKPDTRGIDHIYATPVMNLQASGWTSMDKTGIVAQASDHAPVYSTLTIPAIGGGQPVPYQNAVYDGSAPDPAVIRGDDGTYHVYATGKVHLTSTDLVNWKKDNSPIVNGMPANARNCWWAPDVAKIGSTYVMTWTGGGGDCSPRDGSVGIHYAVSSKAEGPYKYKSRLSLDHGYAIDSHIMTDGNKSYIYFGGGIIKVAEITLEGESLTTKGPTRTLLQRINPGDETLEGEWVVKRGDYYYLFYSYGHYQESSNKTPREYSVRIARSVNPMGPFAPRGEYKPVLQGKDPFRGPGHNSIAVDDAGQDWMVYHAWSKGKRVLMIDKITYPDGWPVVNDGNGPSSELVPDGPVIGTAESNPGVGAGNWAWPVDKSWWKSNRADWMGAHTMISGTFTSPYAKGMGSDIGDPPNGSAVYAMLGGKVIKTNLCGAGEGMIIESQTSYGKLQIAYGHGTNPRYKVGDTVPTGSQILNLGEVGCKVSGGHLHIDMALSGRHICPQDVFLTMDSGQEPNLLELVNKAKAPCGI